MSLEVEKVLVTETQVVVSQPETREIIVSGLLGPPGPRGASTIADMDDVNLNTLASGSVLVYDTVTRKWISKTLLNQQQVDCGEF